MVNLAAQPLPRRDVATQAFVELLLWFRKVLLQDAVFMRQKFPAMQLWLHPPFNHPLFEEFSSHLLHEADYGEDPKMVQITRAIPQVANILQSHHQNTIETLTTLYQSHSMQTLRLDGKVDQCYQLLQPMNEFLYRLSTSGVRMQTLMTLDPESGSLSTQGLPAQGASQPPVTASSRSEELGLVLDNTASSTESSADTNIPQYRISDKVLFVSQLWEEYDQGFVAQPGMPRGPAIRDLNERFDTKWRRDEKFRKPYSRRRLIWEAILKAADNLNMPTTIVAEKMERWQRNHGYSLNKINTLLLESSKTGKGLWGENNVDLLSIV